MSADSINKKIRKAYGKVGKKLGYDFELYRPVELKNQINNSSYIDTQKVAFSIDEKFMKSFTADKMPIYTTYIDGMLENLFDIASGDILYSQDSGDTYIVGMVETHKPIMCFKCNNTITAYNTSYSNPGTGFAGSDTEVASSIPCYIDIKGAAGSDLDYMPVNSYGKDPYSTATITVVDPLKEIDTETDILDSDNRRWDIINVEYTVMGTVLHCELYK